MIREIAFLARRFAGRTIGFSSAFLVATTVAGNAADPSPGSSPTPIPYVGPQTLTGDWFGQGQAMRNDAGIDLRLEWSQFYEGMTQGAGDKTWQLGGKWDAQLRLNLSKLGFWDGLSVTAQGVTNTGHSVNGQGGALIPPNAGLFFPGIVGADRSDLMALYVTQNFGDLVSLLVGKFSMIEFARSIPLRGGGGVDTFWNVEISTPITGLTPPTLQGAQVRINTQPVSFSLMVFDPQDTTNRPLFADPFKQGVSVMGTATLKTSIAGLSGNYGLKGIYSTKAGPDLSDLVPSAINDVVNNKRGSYFVSFSMQQYLIQDPKNPARGWGVFGEIGKADGNPNTQDWTTYFGIGGNSLIPGRPDDRFGIAYFNYGTSHVLINELAPILSLRSETGVEMFYNLAVTPWFRIAADVQFITPPIGAFPNAIFAGLSSYVRF